MWRSGADALRTADALTTRIKGTGASETDANSRQSDCGYCALRSSVLGVAVQTGRLDTTQLLKGVLDVVVLAALSDRDSYGYDVVRRLRVAGLDDIGDASVYGTLRRLFAEGLLSCYVVPSDEGPHRKYYGLTPVGRKALDQQRDGWAGFAVTVHGILDGSLLNDDTTSQSANDGG